MDQQFMKKGNSTYTSRSVSLVRSKNAEINNKKKHTVSFRQPVTHNFLRIKVNKPDPVFYFGVKIKERR